eukprot:264863-Prymnesium_polylepis.1
MADARATSTMQPGVVWATLDVHGTFSPYTPQHKPAAEAVARAPKVEARTLTKPLAVGQVGRCLRGGRLCGVWREQYTPGCRLCAAWMAMRAGHTCVRRVARAVPDCPTRAHQARTQHVRRPLARIRTHACVCRGGVPVSVRGTAL